MGGRPLGAGEHYYPWGIFQHDVIPSMSDSWMERGACNGKTWEQKVFFVDERTGVNPYNKGLTWPERREQRSKKVERAKDYCNRCEVRQKCLEFSILFSFEFGIWGGEEEKDRQVWIRRNPRWVACKYCGSLSWREHERNRRECGKCRG